MKRSNIDASQMELTEKVVTIKRVTKVVKGGRTMRFSALVVVGDNNGHVGVGLGKSTEIPEAIRKGKEDAAKHLVTVALDEVGSISHDYIGKYGSAEVLLKKSPDGTGIIAGGAMRHRFFLVFQYEANMRAKHNTAKAILQRLNEEADTARRYLDACELEVLEPRYSDNFVLKLLYEILNKQTGQRVRLPDGVFDMTTAVHGIYEDE